MSIDSVILHGLNAKVKYVRLVRRKINGRNRFYAQLVCQGKPFIKPKNTLGQGEVGLDLGPSTIAVVSLGDAQLKQFADKLELVFRTISKIYSTRHVRSPGESVG